MKRTHESVDYIAHPDPKTLVNDVTQLLNSQSQRSSQRTGNGTNVAPVPPVPLFRANSAPIQQQRSDASASSSSSRLSVELNPANSASSSNQSSPRGNASTSQSPTPLSSSFDLTAAMSGVGVPTTTASELSFATNAAHIDQVMQGDQSNLAVPSTFISAFAQVRDSHGSKYTVYLVHVTYAEHRWVVYRRYNDFKEVYDSLSKSSWNATVQPLPRKTLFSNYSREFLTKRLEELHRWLAVTFTTPVLLQIPGVREFFLNNINAQPNGMSVPTFVTIPGQIAGKGLSSLGNQLVKSVNDVAPNLPHREYSFTPTKASTAAVPIHLQENHNLFGNNNNDIQRGSTDTESLSVDSDSEIDDAESLLEHSVGSATSSSSSSSSDMDQDTRTIAELAQQFRAPNYPTTLPPINAAAVSNSAARTAAAITPRSPLSPNNGPSTPSIEVPRSGAYNQRPGAKARKAPSLRERIQKGKVETDRISPKSTKDMNTAQRLAQRHKAALEDFEQIRVLGKGSFGKVVLVRQKATSKHFAMKILKKNYVVQKKQVEHTKTERSVLSQMNHPFIVKLHYAFQTGDKLHFVLDFCPGGELFFHLGRAGRFDEELGRFYAAEISLALGHLHERGVVYRDLKPENILFDETGHIKLADFGLSKEGIRSGTEGTHSFCGTPEYLAPEVLSRSGHGTSVDWWSLGALLFEMLTGLPPWYNQNRNMMFEAIQRSALRFPPFVSQLAQDVLSQFLQRNALVRLGSTDDVEEIKQHPFFASIDWTALYNRQVEPPFVPNVQNQLDTSNFENTFTRLPLDSVAQCDDIVDLSRSRVESNTFDGFTFTDPSIINTLSKGMGSMSLRRSSGLSLSRRRCSLAGSLSPATAMYAKNAPNPPGSGSSTSTTHDTPVSHIPDSLQFSFQGGAGVQGGFPGSFTSPVHSNLVSSDGNFGMSPHNDPSPLMTMAGYPDDGSHDTMQTSSLDEYC